MTTPWPTRTRRHADELAHRLGEPAGTLLLTLAVTGLEVAMVDFVMSTGAAKPVLARDTMFAVVTLVLTLLVSLLTFSLPRTNVLLGCVHLLLFGAYLMLMFDR